MKRPPWVRGWAEAAAMLGQFGYLLSDLGPTGRGGQGGSGRGSAILLHGLYATAGVWRPLRTLLENELGFSTFTFSYGFGPGIVELAERLSDHARQQRRGMWQYTGALYLIGHSLGGLVATYAAQFGALQGEVSGVITLGAPFRGSRRASLVPGHAGRELNPGHPLLRRLSAGPSRVVCPQLAILAEEDALVEPGAAPEFGERVCVPAVGHNGLLFESSAHELVLRQLRSWQEADAKFPRRSGVAARPG